MRSIRVRRAAAIAGAALIAALLAAWPAPATRVPATARGATYPPYPASLTVKSELRMKANLAQKFDSSPQLVFFGGSRSQRFDPAYARRVLKLRTMNFALSNGRPECAWAYVNWIYHRWPNAKLRFVWGIQPTMFNDRDLNPALLQDKRFYPYFPDSLLASQRKRLPTRVSDMPKYYAYLSCSYSNRGLLLWNVYDLKRSKGYTLDKSLDDYIDLMMRGARAGGLDTRAREYFEKTIKLLNDHGTTPIIVMMPVHPRVHSVLQKYGISDGHLGILDYLTDLRQTLSLKIVNYYRIQSFGGNADWFYDGVHVMRGNADRMIARLRTDARQALKEPVTPTPIPTPTPTPSETPTPTPTPSETASPSPSGSPAG